MSEILAPCFPFVRYVANPLPEQHKSFPAFKE
jgi:hypothetical protein